MDGTLLVVGASRGIGLELARQASARGDSVIATARRPAEARELAALDLRVESLDVDDAASVQSFAGAMRGVPIDVLVHNAGIGGHGAALAELDPEGLVPVFRTNAVAPLRIAQAMLPNLRAGRAKKLLFMTSLMGSIADNASGDAYAYRASKAALNMIAKSLSIDLAPERITVAVLHPGWVRTDMGGPSAPLTVEESVRGLLRVIDGLDRSQSGRFFDYEGDELPW